MRVTTEQARKAIHTLQLWLDDVGASMDRVLLIDVDSKVYEILSTVSKVLDVNTADLRGRSREHYICVARHIFIGIALEQGFKTVTLATLLNRDHSTIVWSRKQYQDYLKYEEHFREKVEKVKKELYE